MYLLSFIFFFFWHHLLRDFFLDRSTVIMPASYQLYFILYISMLISFGACGYCITSPINLERVTSGLSVIDLL
jgi:hypothetical protein